MPGHSTKRCHLDACAYYHCVLKTGYLFLCTWTHCSYVFLACQVGWIAYYSCEYAIPLLIKQSISELPNSHNHLFDLCIHDLNFMLRIIGFRIYCNFWHSLFSADTQAKEIQVRIMSYILPVPFTIVLSCLQLLHYNMARVVVPSGWQGLFILHSLCYGCWWLGTKGQGIRSHGIDQAQKHGHFSQLRLAKSASILGHRN